MPYNLLEGVKVIELSMYAFAPASTAVLSDWGADVIKIVPPGTADPMLGKNIIAGLPDIDPGVAFMWENLNRGKRCICIDVASDEGCKVLHRLLEQADVFVTNLLPGARARFGLEYDAIAKINPRIIYGSASAHGSQGPERDTGGFDHTDFWSRSGIAHSASSVAGEFIPQPGPAMGDVSSGANLAGAISAALYRRERTGKGALIEVSLLSTGVWMNGPSILASKLYGVETIPRYNHANQRNPLVTAYTTRDNRQIYMAGVQTEKNWAQMCDVLEARELVTDPRFETGELRLKNVCECIVALDHAFAKQDLAYWLPRFERCPVPWSVIQTSAEAFDDPQVAANGFIVGIEGDNLTYPVAASPAQVDGQHLAQRRAPQHGENTEEVLMEFGLEWDEIEGLKAAGAIN